MRISVEGNIGSGKSTALAALARHDPEAAVLPEPVDEWGELLRAFYARPAEYALAFQLRVLLSFHGAPESCVTERSPLACRHVFGQILANDGHMTPQQWDVFKDYHAALGWAPDAIVYVDTPADVCLARVQARAREGEAPVDLTYLRRVEFQYETLLKYTTVPVTRVDGTLPPDQISRAIAAAFA